MTIPHDQVAPPVVIVVDKCGSPAEKGDCRLADAYLKRNVGEICVTVVSVERVRIVGKVRDMKIHAAIVIVIADRQAHTRLLAAVFVQCEPRLVSDLFEGSVVLIDVELLWRRIVDHYEIQPAVIVYVNENGRKSVVQ